MREAVSTSVPTPATCSSSTRTAVPHRCRRRRPRQPLRLAEHLTPDGALSDDGHRRARRVHPAGAGRGRGPGLRVGARVRDVGDPRGEQRRRGPAPGAAARPTSTCTILTGEDEARLTFLAVRRWFGWSSGRLAVFDIGGGSLEIAAGADERPDVAVSFELGAGRLTRQLAARRRPDRRSSSGRCASTSGPRSPARQDRCCATGVGDHTVATSKTFRSLARMCGAAAVRRGPVRTPGAAPRGAQEDGCRSSRRCRRTSGRSCPGVSATEPTRWWPAALVAEAAMDLFDIDALEICPWALREGVILQKLDRCERGRQTYAWA